MPDRYNNFKKIQSVFAHCFFNTVNTKKIFNEISDDKKNNFSRYYFFLQTIYQMRIMKLKQIK